MGFPTRLLGDGESVVLTLRPHVKRLFGPVVLLLVVAPVATFVAGLVPDGQWQLTVRWAVAGAAALVLARWTLWPFLVWWNTIYVVTDRRLVMRHGVLSRSGHDMPLTRLNDVSFSHNLVERMLGCGTLVVESAGERGQVVLKDVPRVEQVQRTLYRLSDVARGPQTAAEGSVPGQAPWDAAPWDATQPLPQGRPPGGDGDAGDGVDEDGGAGRGRRRWGGRR